MIASDPNAQHKWYRDESWSPGVGGPKGSGFPWWLSIGYSPATGNLKMVADYGTGIDTITWSYDLPGQSFTKARIGTDFGSTPWDASYTYTPPAKPVKAAAYAGVHLTSYSGHRDDLSSWWMHHKLLAVSPSRSLVAFPSNPTGAGANFQTWYAPNSAQSSS